MAIEGESPAKDEGSESAHVTQTYYTRRASMARGRAPGQQALSPSADHADSAGSATLRSENWPLRVLLG